MPKRVSYTDCGDGNLGDVLVALNAAEIRYDVKPAGISKSKGGTYVDTWRVFFHCNLNLIDLEHLSAAMLAWNEDKGPYPSRLIQEVRDQR